MDVMLRNNDRMPNDLEQMSSFSNKSASNYFQKTRIAMESASDFTPEKQFRQLIANRHAYLDSLKKLPDNWINGNSKAPTHKILKICHEILNELECFTIANKLLPNAKIIMSPSPDGSFVYEFTVSSNQLFITVGEHEIHLELCKNDYYSDLPDIDPHSIIQIQQQLGILLNG